MAIAALSTAALAGSAATGYTAMADHGGRGHDDHGHHRGQTLFSSNLAPSVPTDQPIHGVAAGGVPWVIRHGDARLRADGRLRVDIRGLVIPSLGNAGPVTTVNASLYCGNDTTAAGTTGSVPLSQSGDAEIRDRLTLPAKCLGAVVLVHPNGNGAAYIAASGFGG